MTVVIPTHFGGRFVREAVESVRGQTLDDWEIKVVCDGCDDEMSDLRKDPRIEVIAQRRAIDITRSPRGDERAQGSISQAIDFDFPHCCWCNQM